MRERRKLRVTIPPGINLDIDNLPEMYQVPGRSVFLFDPVDVSSGKCKIADRRDCPHRKQYNTTSRQIEDLLT